MKSNSKIASIKPDGLKDFALILGGALILLPVFYLISNTQMNIWTLSVYILIMYPTLAALVKGAPFVPTPMEVSNRMIEIADLKKGQIVYDIGCGDGRVVYLASKKHDVKATGFELSPFIYALARIRHFLWKSKAKIKFRNFKKQNLSNADVIFCYLLPETMTRLAKKLNKELKPGAKVVSYSFPIKAWKEKEKFTFPDNKFCAIWLYEKK